MAGRPIDIEAICRLCLSDQNTSLKSIFDENLNSSFLPQKVAFLLQIQISKYDKLSTMVCNDCIIRLDTWYAYKRQCHRNQTKLVEWLNISKSGPELNSTTFHVKPEPIEAAQHGLVPVKVELSYEEDDFGGDMHTNLYPSDENEHLYLEDLDVHTLETDDDRRCPDCGRMFGSFQNRRRHQTMMHEKKERRAQMTEIRRSFDCAQQADELECDPMDLEPISSDITPVSAGMTISSTASQDDSTEIITENGEKIANETTSSVNESTDFTDKADDMDRSIGDGKRDAASEENKHSPSQKQETANKVEDKTEVTNEADAQQQDEKKIQFAAGLRLVQKDAAPIELEPLSKIELSYIEKCKAMVSMFQTLQCACHNVQHKTIRYLLSHLRETRIWFPLFTCYNCMVSLTGRSTFTKHHSRCPRPQLETLIKLSNVRKRSEVKSRLYQNFKCNRCNFLFSFHEDFCKHIDEDHAYGSPPFYCSCRYVFDSLDEYKKHCYTSCILSYYCDICFITTPTVEEFVKHAQELHDSSEGFMLLQENTYIPRSNVIRHKEANDESNVVEGKRERRRSAKEPIMVQIYDREIPPDLKEIPTRVIKKMIQFDSSTPSNSPTKCPLCKKQYSSVNNMMRHYRTHIERKEVDIPKTFDETGTENEDLYTCPDCGGVYPASKWSKHLEEKHPAKTCSECDKEFQFQSELEQHRSVHLNIKVYRDSKTHAYRSAMVSPTTESNGDVMMVMCDTMCNTKEEPRSHKQVVHDFSGRSSAMDEEPADAKDSVESSKPFCEQCNRQFASAKSLRDHVLNKHGSGFLKKKEFPKKCDYCDKMCSTGASLKIHTQMHERVAKPSGKSAYPKKCEYCDKVCITGAGLYKHTQLHERVTLGELKKKKDDKKKLDTIKTEKEDESYHTCKRCFKVFATKGKLKEHMKCHGNANKSKKSRKVLCDLCHSAFDTSDALAKHKLEEHSDELDGMPILTNELEVYRDTKDDVKNETIPAIIYACDICEATFSSKPDLRTHKEVHSKPKSKTNFCKYCKVAFDSVSELTKHMHLEHGESAKPKITKERVKADNPDKAFKCPICRKGFASLNAMSTHCGWHKRTANKNSTENTPQATASAKLAKRERALRKIAAAAVKKEEPVETSEFQCSTCFMELPNDTALQIHILEKHGSLDALMLIPRCNTCNQDFVTQEEYDTHKRFHDFLERQKKHEPQQMMQTPIIQSIKTVVETPTHQGSKKFPCTWCNSIFSRQDTLNTHVKNHHKEHVKTEFECNQCNRVFDKQNSLTIHLKVHQKQKNAAAAAQVQPSVGGTGKVYVCSLCNMGFSFPKDLRMHTINAHPF